MKKKLLFLLLAVVSSITVHANELNDQNPHRAVCLVKQEPYAWNYNYYTLKRILDKNGNVVKEVRLEDFDDNAGAAMRKLTGLFINYRDMGNEKRQDDLDRYSELCTQFKLMHVEYFNESQSRYTDKDFYNNILVYETGIESYLDKWKVTTDLK